jgi:magnesium transporter
MDLFECVNNDHRSAMVEVLREGLDAEILVDLDVVVRENIIDLLGVGDFAAAVVKLDSDDALFVLEILDKESQKQLLGAMKAYDKQLIEEGVAYKENSDRRLMQRELVSVLEFWTVGDIVDYLRSAAENEKVNLPIIFIAF